MSLSALRPVAIVGWEEGLAGQIASWPNDCFGYSIDCFVHPFDSPVPQPTQADRDARHSSLFEYPEPNSFRGLPLLSSADWIHRIKNRGVSAALVTLSDNRKRQELIETAKQSGVELVNAIHSSAHVAEESQVATNVIVLPNAFIGYRAIIEDGAILHVGCQIDHHSVVRSCVTVGPAAVIAGNVLLDEGCTVWSGAVVKQRIRVGKRAVVGAGSVVLHEIPDGSTAYGVPARTTN